MIRCLSLVVLWLGGHVVSGGVEAVEGVRDGLAGLRDVTRRLAVRRLALLRCGGGELPVGGVRLTERLDHQRVGAAVGRAELLAAERLGGLAERVAERAR